MKRLLAIALTASFGFVAGNVYAALVDFYPVSTLANGIAYSRHNLGSMGNFIHSVGSNGQKNTDQGGPPGGPGGTSEICVFCHAPHFEYSDPYVFIPVIGISTPAPLWNRQGKSPLSSFKAYGATIGGSSIANSDLIARQSLACLSCHDGVTTFDVLANGPGQGGIAPQVFGAQTAASMWMLTPTTGTGPWSGSGFKKDDDFIGAAGAGPNNLGSEARLNIGNTGNDLSNDHPVSVLYSDGNVGAGAPDTTKRASLRDRTTVINSIDLRTGLALSTTNSAELNANLSQNRWAILGAISDTATISDLLKANRVECTSCHDPHFKNLSNIELNNTALSGNGNVAWSDGLFLRRVGGNAGSGVCRTCHNK